MFCYSEPVKRVQIGSDVTGFWELCMQIISDHNSESVKVTLALLLEIMFCEYKISTNLLSI